MHASEGLIQVLIYLAAMVVVVPVTKRLGLGAVLGYLIAGVLLGPHIFGLIQESRDSALHISEFGVIMMLLLIGLELNPSVLWKLRGPIFGLGGLQVSLTALAVLLIAYIQGEPWQVGLSAGFVLAMSSTAIVLQTLQEKGLNKSNGGERAFSVLLFQDIAVIPILAVLPMLASSLGKIAEDSATTTSPLMHFGLLIGAVLLVAVGGRYLLRPIFRYIAASKLRETFTALALLLVFAITALMQVVGLSPALGAFLAGVVLADSEYRHQIESDIEPFKGLLLGVFFISVGSGIDFSWITAHLSQVLVYVFGLIALKGVIVYGLGKLTRMPKQDSLLFAVSLAQGGEFAFVILGIIGNGSILTNDQTQLLIATVALSMGLAPILISAYVKWIDPLFARAETREADVVDEKDNPVLVVGVGRFGQTIIRLLKASGYKTTVLDFDAEQIEVIRKFGIQSYYGDASRPELLHAAGIENAKVLVLALDDKEKTTEIVKYTKQHFPHLKIFARAYDRIHAYELLHLGVDDVYVETSGSALNLGTDVLKSLGIHPRQAVRSAQIFKQKNDQSIRELARVYHEADESTFVSHAKNWLEAMEKMFRTDTGEMQKNTDRAWEPAPRTNNADSPKL